MVKILKDFSTMALAVTAALLSGPTIALVQMTDFYSALPGL
ncbi:hypothetical protein [Azospirillum palustre]